MPKIARPIVVHLKGLIKALFRSRGYEIVPRATTPLVQRLLSAKNIEMIFDVGANDGVSGKLYRSFGYAGSIVSFEPVSHLFQRLEECCAKDPRWQCERVALGSVSKVANIYVSGGHGGASSLLQMTDIVYANAPDQAVIRTEDIRVEPLAVFFEKHYPRGNNCFLKIDVQGNEYDVLRGVGNALPQISMLQLELSLVQNYEGERLFCEMLPYLRTLGFYPVEVICGWASPESLELFQVDVVFLRQ